MTAFEWIIGILLIVLAVILVVTVVFQSGKEKGLSGSIVGGGADSFGGKSKKAKRDAQLNTVTTILSIVFAVLAVALYIFVTSTN